MTEEISVQPSSDNVFADLGLDNPDELLVKAELVRQINEIIARQKMNQLETAELLGVEESKISALVKGKLSVFSTERLFRFLNALGCDVEIVVKLKPKSEIQAQTKVCSYVLEN